MKVFFNTKMKQENLAEKAEAQIESENKQEEEEEKESLVEEKEQAYPKIKSKIEILDVLFHPTQTNLITLGLINGKLKM